MSISHTKAFLHVFLAIPPRNMASFCPHSWLETPTFNFNSPTQSEDWRTFYTRALNYLDALDIEPDQADDNHKGWKQLKLMFEGEDRQAFQTLIDNQTIMPEDMKKPRATLDTIMTTIMSEVHFGPIGMNLSLILGSSRQGNTCTVSVHLQPPNASFPTQNSGDGEDHSSPACHTLP